MNIFKIITTIAYLLICGNADAEGISAGGSDGGFSDVIDGGYISVNGQVHSVGDPRFDWRRGTVTGVTISVAIHAGFFVGEYLSTGIDYNSPLTVGGYFSARGGFPGDYNLGYSESFNISGVGFVHYDFDRVFTQLIPRSDWSKFVHFQDDQVWESFSAGASSIGFTITSLNSEDQRFVGMSVGESAEIDYQYDEPPLAAGVPEPASCALMLMGLCAVGFSARKRNPMQDAFR